MRFVGSIGFANQTGSNGPYGFVGNHNIGHLFLGHIGQITRELHGADLVLDVQIVFALGLANTKDGLHTRGKNLEDLAVDGVVVVAEDSSALRVPAKNIFASNGFNHRSRNTTGVGTLIFEEDGLGSNGDTGFFDGILDLGNEGEWREDNDLGTERILVIQGACLITQQLGQSLPQFDGIIFGSRVHLPVTGHDGLTTGLEGCRGGDIRAKSRGEGLARSEKSKGGKGGGELHFEIL
mmetsp:Transcript_28028/g.61765  ORF Transcript_28028/g.61765 Transcript_28028/m.61765 type:complete len:237 (-) Transcript_28028:147-857(-)